MASLDNCEDVTPPEVLEFDYTPKTINTTQADQTITVTIRVADDLSGMPTGPSLAGLWFRSPTAGQQQGTFFRGGEAGCLPPYCNLIAGDMMDGTFQNTFTVPRYAQRGTWQISQMYLQDTVGNYRHLDVPTVAAMGFPTTFTNG